MGPSVGQLKLCGAPRRRAPPPRLQIEVVQSDVDGRGAGGRNGVRHCRFDDGPNGTAAGLEAGRSYEPGVPKRKKKNDKATLTDTGQGLDTDTSQGLEAFEDVDSKQWLSTWHVATSVSEMRNRMPKECDVDRMLTDFPNILAMDVPALFEDLSRVYPTQNPGDVLRRDPRIAYQVRTRPQSF